MLPLYEKLFETPATVWVALAAIAAVAALVFLIAKDKRRWSVNMLVTAAVCLALGFVLSCVRLYKMPQGGSITPASMLPIMAFAYIFGVVPGLLLGLAYSLLQLMQDPFFLNPIQVLLDYILAFSALALGGLFRNSMGIPGWLRLGAGIAIATTARMAFHVIAGAVYFAEYAGDANPWIYSLIYNATSAGLDGLICILIALLPPVRKFIQGNRDKQGALIS